MKNVLEFDDRTPIYIGGSWENTGAGSVISGDNLKYPMAEG